MWAQFTCCENAVLLVVKEHWKTGLLVQMTSTMKNVLVLVVLFGKQIQSGKFGQDSFNESYQF